MDWAKNLTDAQWAHALAGGDSRAPAPPSVDLQAMFVGSSGAAAYLESQVFWRLTKDYFSARGGQVDSNTRVLDIGVGWGRNYRWMLRDLPAENLIGIDVDAKMIKLCQEAMPFGQFYTIAPGRDYPVEGGPYDVAIAYSVFSHLSESAAKLVLASAHKAIKPQGIFALTTFRAAHIDIWNQQIDAPVYGGLLAEAQFNRQEWWERATEGQHLYLQTGGGDPSRPAESYGEAVAPKGWWEHVEGYRLVCFERRHDLPQSYVVLERV